MNAIEIPNLEELVSKAASVHKITNYDIKIEGKTDKGDGFSGQIFFVSLNSERQSVKLAVKCSTTSKIFREQISVVEAYQKEMYIYNQVLPAFQKFLKDSEIPEKLDFMTECYSTHLFPEREILVFENLRVKRFELWDKKKIMPPEAVELILEAYAKWHGMSMVLKRRKPEVYKKLIENNVNMFSKLCDEGKMIEMVAGKFQKMRKLIVNEDNKEDFKEILQYTSDDVRHSFTEMFFNSPDHHVILHGDCWNNNYLFQFDEDRKPSGVRVLDWQCSGVGVPAIDLSHYLYSALDTSKYTDIRATLAIYHKHLSTFLAQFGMQSEEVYSFRQLLEDWRNSSRFGLFLSCYVIQTLFANHEDLPDFDDPNEKRDFSQVFDFGNDIDERYVERLRNNFLHYCRNMEYEI